jgi:GNAT superfamily N-acetyltransferase
MSAIAVRRLDAAREADLFRVLAGEEGCAWCACVAWHVDTWDGFVERTAAANRALRDELFARGVHDGYLAYAAGEPVGWCQVAPREALPKIARETAELGPADAHTWAIGCFEVRPAQRTRGVARALLAAVLADLPARGARRVLAFPKRGAESRGEPGELWNGPESLFRAAGFAVLRDDAVRPVLALTLH